jgi:hypothetical protein
VNTNLLSIIKRIIAEQGESILGDPQRLKRYVSDYAKDEPKEDRAAFGRAVEQGFYQELKRAAHGSRMRVKATLVSRLQALTGFDASRCAAAVDLLEAAITPAAEDTGRGSPAPVAGGASALGAFPRMPRITARTLIFGLAAGAGALAGALLSRLFMGETQSQLENIIDVGLWAGLTGLGISIALIMAQTLYLKKKFVIGSILKSAFMGIAVGAVSGALAQLIYGFTQHISPLVNVVSRVLCWGLLGWGLGWGVSFYIPNYPKRRAMLAGFIGGITGGVLCATLETAALGEAVLGLVTGIAISWVEEALREAWITVFWGPKESRSIALGKKPLVFGSTPEADIYLAQKHGDAKPLPVRAAVSLENGRVVLEDKQTGQHSVLPNGGEFTLDRLRIVVNTK